ncbi:MAG: HPF/RaiA family ribosome-associated protein [Planctomycetota bacterium]|nr:MAG: HPF/RaiA family ribosome-associated protein [Planctomycetota bacterium]REJ91400.1 MAG: HPF/RaiA family ribosome-associated protein [Planctomycetota bacterium]REK18480.1 MAG: HPF/RaiA family ribosome-associated protein [Planctomycetota bacterium]REK39459.1 MAG: HPF/RaiA family ribosome-associated protein [Planctomycetota bacterium]
MRLTIVDREKSLTAEQREFAERRLMFALARFESRIQRVKVVVNDVNGPRGGVDQHCRITVQLRRMRDVVVSNRDVDLKNCVARAADRAGRAVARAVDRFHQFDRVPASRTQTAWS